LQTLFRDFIQFQSKHFVPALLPQIRQININKNLFLSRKIGIEEMCRLFLGKIFRMVTDWEAPLQAVGIPEGSLHSP